MRSARPIDWGLCAAPPCVRGGRLAVLEARGLRVTVAQHERVLACTDLEQLEGWVRRAVTVKTTAALFAPPERPAKTRR